MDGVRSTEDKVIDIHPDDADNLVRQNLLKRPKYSPYCMEHPKKCSGPRMFFHASLDQFQCPDCGNVTELPEDFIKRYYESWGKDQIIQWWGDLTKNYQVYFAELERKAKLLKSLSERR